VAARKRRPKGARKSRPHCGECGAELTIGSDRCPLCGTEWTSVKRPVIYDRDRYQAAIRDLREELRRIRREDAEAV
jgi:uncharacterized Zn finger protein (UPF0148 family)